MDRLAAIQVFLSLAETESFTATADKLELSRPMVTRAIGEMEEWLNARLFQRTTRKVSLTEAGKQAVVFCQKIANLQQELEQEMAAQSGELRGVLRISSNASFGASHLVQVMNAFLNAHPKLQIQLDLSDKVINLLEERIDLAIRFSNNPEPNLVARKLAECHSLLVATPNYLAQYGEPKTPEDLKQHRYLAHANINRKEWRFTQNGQEISLELTSQITTNDTMTLLNAVLADGGVAMLPKYLLGDYLATGSLKPILTDWQLPTYTVYALYPSRHKLPMAVRMLLDYLVERFAGSDW